MRKAGSSGQTDCPPCPARVRCIHELCFTEDSVCTLVWGRQILPSLTSVHAPVELPKLIEGLWENRPQLERAVGSVPGPQEDQNPGRGHQKDAQGLGRRRCGPEFSCTVWPWRVFPSPDPGLWACVCDCHGHTPISGLQGGLNERRVRAPAPTP